MVQPALASIAKMDEEIDTLHRHIIAYLGRVSQVELTEARSRDLIGLMEAANDLESIGDLIETDLVELGTVINTQELQRSSSEQISVADLTGVAVQDIQISKAVREALFP